MNERIKKILQVVDYIGLVISWFSRSLHDFPVYKKQESETGGRNGG